MRAQDLVDAHVQRFNKAVREGDWHAYGQGFAPDATVAFDGVPVPPMVGQDAIVAGYRSAPPDDTINVLSTNVDGNSVSVAFAWNAEPQKQAGTMDIEVADGLISNLTVRLG